MMPELQVVTQPAPDRAALVLAGGGARAAYEIGILDYLFRDVASAIGHPPRIDFVCGTSAGAINASVVAAHADDPVAGIDLLVRRWRALSIERILMLEPWRIWWLFTALLLRRGVGRYGIGALLDPRPIAALLADVPFERIRDHLHSGRLSAFGVTATQIATGKSVFFLERGRGVVLEKSDPDLEVREVPIRKEHALASAAIPMLFHPVRIEGELYCDGGLGPDLPLSTAASLGARRLLMARPHSSISAAVSTGLRVDREEVASDPMYLAGKAIDALLNDRGDEDLERMRQRDRFALTTSLCIHPSQRIGVIAAELMASKGFRARTSGLAGTALRALTDSLPEADVVSYLLFDGEFAARLIDLGRADARAHHDALCQMFATGTLRAAEGE